ncbi:SpoIIIAH-like family protein [Evansella cellulosilytica]|uniref:Mutants block sporulation after engulfment n=1 Tax=Evansella cellulosilytica (strain ATCC 21833 / DSM 2522 / FERM P-1141 / JCM 9156 / N-4) TaxID=649639 RepID=E6TXP5_EVAC2|nr:SpoIIIAH-like family protein [Evansella cellulosilytica]ADU29971.1 mutants block sporulation after engulfment [Evansella cellulosilytica DSM 2522]
MVLKRQTVWLLTMLSLIVVLSAYYLTMPNMQDQEALGEEEEPGNDLEMNMDDIDEEDVTFIEIEEVEDVLAEGDFFSDASSVNEMFDTIRLRRADSRARLMTEFMEVFHSDGAASEVQLEALDRREALETLGQKEENLEELLRAKGYDDALVIAEENMVQIYVKADELTNVETVEILNLSRDHLGIEEIRVGYQSEN